MSERNASTQLTPSRLNETDTIRHNEIGLSGPSLHNLATMVAIALMSLGLSAFMSIRRPPQPTNMDEFSYLLAADTFSKGRLTNETHPLWIHFESLHIIQKPTYASKYPPGPGLILAAGKLLGWPIIGAWLSTALACAAIHWMLLMCLPTRWAFFGGLISLSHPLLITWSQTYFGASLAVAAGALVIGAFATILHNFQTPHKYLLATGAGVLSFTRPYEGAVLVTAVMLALAFASLRNKWFLRFLTRVVLPVVIVLTLPLAWTAHYNWRVTGNALTFPYTVHEATYGIVPLFVFQRLKPEPEFRHEAIRKFHKEYESDQFSQRSYPSGLPRHLVSMLYLLSSRLFNNHLLILPLLILPFLLLKDGDSRYLSFVGAVFLAGLQIVSWFNFSYAAPILGLCILLSLKCMNELIRWRIQKVRVGLYITIIISSVVFSVFLLLLGHPEAVKAGESMYGYKRAAIIEALTGNDDRHLIIVRYGPFHRSAEEWVYNDADIDASKIVWAREMDRASNKRLIDYFKGRKVWLLNADADAPALIPYPYEHQ